jgi:hypothetical protein
MEDIAFLYDEDHPLYWRWLGMAARRGNYETFIENFCNHVADFVSSGGKNAAVIFEIGRALNGQVNVEEETIFPNFDRYEFDFSHFVAYVDRPLDFYEKQLRSCRSAVNNWTLVGIRFKVVKDIRILIAKLIWDARCEASYEYDIFAPL